MQLVRLDAKDRKWSSLPYGKGVSLSPLLPNGRGGGSALLRFEPNSKFPAHDHPGGAKKFMSSREAYGSGTKLLRRAITSGRRPEESMTQRASTVASSSSARQTVSKC